MQVQQQSSWHKLNGQPCTSTVCFQDWCHYICQLFDALLYIRTWSFVRRTRPYCTKQKFCIEKCSELIPTTLIGIWCRRPLTVNGGDAPLNRQRILQKSACTLSFEVYEHINIVGTSVLQCFKIERRVLVVLRFSLFHFHFIFWMNSFPERLLDL